MNSYKNAVSPPLAPVLPPKTINGICSTKFTQAQHMNKPAVKYTKDTTQTDRWLLTLKIATLTLANNDLTVSLC